MGSIKELEDRLRAAVEKLRQPSYMRKLGNFAADMVRLRTRLGYGVQSAGAVKDKLKALSAKYIELRQDMQHVAENSALLDKARKSKSGNITSVTKKQIHGHGGLSDLTSPSKSNLTRTGQMLDSIDVKEVGVGRVTFGPKGSRSDGLNNEDIARYVSEKGRPFNNLSATEQKRVQDEIRKAIVLELQKNLTKR